MDEPGDDLPDYTDPDCIQFVSDMIDNGLDVEHYHGRFFWQGPAVRSDERGYPTKQEVIRMTDVELQWDNLGLDWIIYPRSSDSGGR